MKLHRSIQIALLAASTIWIASANAAAPGDATAPTTLSQDQIRDLIRRTADNDIQNDKKQRDYTYVERQEMRKLNGKGQVKSTEIETSDVINIYGEQVQKLVAKNDKPLSDKDARKEDEKIQKLIDKRKNESDSDRKKRLAKEEKDREDERQFVREVADAYNFKFVGIETVERPRQLRHRRRSQARLQAHSQRSQHSPQDEIPGMDRQRRHPDEENRCPDHRYDFVWAFSGEAA